MIAAADNPHFKRVGRAPYEIRLLLSRLSSELSPYQPVSPEDRLIAEAVQRHASNANDTIMHGIEAIGHILTVAALNEVHYVEREHLNNLGALITHLAVEGQMLQELDCTITDALGADDKRRTGGKP